MNSEGKIRVGVIGAGAIGLEHIKGFLNHRQASVVAVCDTSQERIDEARSLYGIESAHRDYHELLARQEVDVVSIALPNDLHAVAARAALEAGKHVLVEKPFAINTAQAMEIAALAARRERLVMVGQNLRMSPKAQMLRSEADGGRFGKIYHLRATWLRRAGIPRIGSWFTRKERSGGGCVFDLGSHILDLALWIGGPSEVATVSAATHAGFGPRGLGDFAWGKSPRNPDRLFDVEDFSAILIRCHSGLTILLEIAWACHHRSVETYNLQIYGTEGGASLTPFEFYQAGDDGYHVIEPEIIPPVRATERMAHFIDCVLGRSTPIVQVEESVAVQKVLDAIYESAALGREVTFC
ncbi:MAG TPA: Gfo/Idh/MocA family oxidoreductase [Chthoniobacteraceae bacterium]|nr:Gfo/Idh/MocA family oxidoreductase [Chthoniobacteraceae bacterium]